MSERWASLGGWESDPDRPGFLKDPTRPGWARTPDGKWWSQADVDNARVVVDEVGAVIGLVLEGAQIRLASTPEDQAHNDLVDLELLRLLKAKRRAKHG